MVIVRKIFWAESWERGLKDSTFSSPAALAWMMHQLHTSSPHDPPFQNFALHSLLQNFPPCLYSFQGTTSPSHEFFMCCNKDLGNILLLIFLRFFVTAIVPEQGASILKLNMFLCSAEQKWWLVMIVLMGIAMEEFGENQFDGSLT